MATPLPDAYTKQHFDNILDDPRAAQGEFADNVDRDNQVRDYLLDLLGQDGTAATARTALGLGTAATLNAVLGNVADQVPRLNASGLIAAAQVPLATGSARGAVPTLPGDASLFFNGQGNFTTPPGAFVASENFEGSARAAPPNQVETWNHSLGGVPWLATLWLRFDQAMWGYAAGQYVPLSPSGDTDEPSYSGAGFTLIGTATQVQMVVGQSGINIMRPDVRQMGRIQAGTGGANQTRVFPVVVR